MLERASKAASAASVFLIVALQLGVHPDLTPVLQGAGAAAFIIGWLAGRSPDARIYTLWMLVAPLAPAVLRGLTGREGPVLDVVWMAGLAGSLLRSSSWSRWTLPVTWRVLLGGWALTLSLAWPVLVAREIGFDLRGLQDAGAINSWAMRSAPHVVAWHLYVVLTQLLGVLWVEWLLGRFADAADRLPRVVHGLWIGVTIASLVAVYQGAVDLSFVNASLWISAGRATGTMLDANPYGVLAALAGPVAFIVLRSRALPRGAGSAVLAVNFLGMWMSGSRTALLCGICGVAALAIWPLRKPQRPARRLAMAAMTATTIAVVIVMAATAVGPWKRLVEVPISTEGAAFVWNRGPYGPTALEMLRDYPLTGVGVGAYHVLAADYWRVATGDPLNWDNAQNWWRHQAAELGLLGAIAPIAWSLLLAWHVIAGRSRADPAAGITVRGLLLGLGLISALGMPTQNPVVMLWFSFLVAWLTALVDEPRLAGAAGRWTAMGAILTTTLAVGYASGHALLARGSLSVVERARRAGHDYIAGAYAPEPLPDGTEFRWTSRKSRFVWLAKTPWLVARLWAGHPDVSGQPVRITLSTPCQVLLDEEVGSTDPLSIGLQLPEGLRILDGSVRVSRTWQPSAYGVNDTRELGAGLAVDLEATRERALAQARVVELRDCRS